MCPGSLGFMCEVLDSSSNFSKYMRVDLHGFQLALDEALR